MRRRRLRLGHSTGDGVRAWRGSSMLTSTLGRCSPPRPERRPRGGTAGQAVPRPRRGRSHRSAPVDVSLDDPATRSRTRKLPRSRPLSFATRLASGDAFGLPSAAWPSEVARLRRGTRLVRVRAAAVSGRPGRWASPATGGEVGLRSCRPPLPRLSSGPAAERSEPSPESPTRAIGSPDRQRRPLLGQDLRQGPRHVRFVGHVRPCRSRFRPARRRPRSRRRPASATAGSCPPPSSRRGGA